MFKVSDIAKMQGQSGIVMWKNISDGNKMTENKNDRSETDFASVQDSLNMQRTASNERIVLSEIPNTTFLTKILLLH